MSESSQAYSCLIQSTLQAIRMLDPTGYLIPEYVMADFSSAIFKALSNSIPQSQFLHCRFHFWNIKYSKLKSKNWFQIREVNRSKIPARFLDYFNLKVRSPKSKKYDPRRIIKYDIAILSKLTSESFFTRYFKIVSPFWTKYAPKFQKMFQKDFILNRAKNGWANFLSNIVPKTNNNLEGYNRALKQTVTNHQSKSFPEFF